MKKLSESNKKDLRQFGLILALILSVLFVVIPIFFFGKSPSMLIISIIAILLVWSLVLPANLKYLYKLWMTVGELLGWVNTRIILGVVFITLFLPISVIMKLMSKDPLHRRLEKKIDSYRITSIQQPPNQIERPY